MTAARRSALAVALTVALTADGALAEVGQLAALAAFAVWL